MELVLIVFLVLLIAGVPVAFAAGIAGASYFLVNVNLPPETIVNVPITASQSTALLAVPLFIFAGVLMNASGITSRLVDLALVLTGHQRGGLARASVVLSTLMGGVSGSANADIAMESRILGPPMEKQGFPRGYTAAVIGYPTLITAIIPPGVGLIMYGSVGNVSIGRLFAAGLAAGLVLFITLYAYVVISARVRQFPSDREHRAPAREVWTALRKSAWAIAFPVLLLGSLRIGLFTPSEVGAFACLYAVLIGLFVYRELDFRSLVKAVRDSVRDVSSIMYLIAMSALFGYGIPFERVPERVTQALVSLGGGAVVAIGLILLLLVVFGLFLEGAIVIILTTPILLPVVSSFGIDPVVFGVVMVLIATLGTLTPPFGVGMFIMQGIIKMDLGKYIRESVPLLVTVLLTAVIFIVFQDILLALPNLIYGG